MDSQTEPIFDAAVQLPAAERIALTNAALASTPEPTDAQATIERETGKPAKLFVLVWLFGAVAVGQAVADTEGRHIYSIEWLVDNSDIVAVIRNQEDGGLKTPRVLRELKGDAKLLSPPLRYPEPPYRKRDFWQFSRDGFARVVFVRGRTELLGEIGVARPRPDGYSPTVQGIYYGVTEYGELLTTQAALLSAIESRVRSGRGRLLVPSSGHQKAESFVMMHAAGFPLESMEVFYSVVVSLTEARRDHYAKVLENGDASERIHAIDALVEFDDEEARQAIRAATRCRDVTPSHVVPIGGTSLKTLTTEDVRKRASHAAKTGY